jgi:DnaA-homolog protein
MQQLPLRIGPAPAPSFDNFLVGANAAPVAALREIGASAAPIYLWGPAGCGKSHLLRARLHAEAARGVRCGAFDPARPAPWRWEEGWALVTIDGCESLDAAQQHAAFALFVEAAGAGVPVLAAGRLPPVDLPVREDLRTRLGWGLVFQLQPIDEPEAAAVLRREAGRRGIALGDEVIAYVMTHFARDLGSLMALLDALDEFALVRQRAVTVPLLRQMLAARTLPESAA